MRALAIIFVLVGLANASPLFDKGGHSGRGDEEIYMTTVRFQQLYLIYIVTPSSFLIDVCTYRLKSLSTVVIRSSCITSRRLTAIYLRPSAYRTGKMLALRPTSRSYSYSMVYYRPRPTG